MNLTGGNATTVCLQAVTEAQAALLAAPTPHGEYTSLTDGGSDVTGPHNRPASASISKWKGEEESILLALTFILRFVKYLCLCVVSLSGYQTKISIQHPVLAEQGSSVP